MIEFAPATTLAEFALRSSLLLGFAVIAIGCAQSRLHDGATKHLFWLLAFGFTLLVPALHLLLPTLSVPWALSAFPAASDGMSSGESHGTAFAAGSLLLAAYFAGIAFLGSRRVAAQIVLHRLWRRAAPADHRVDAIASDLAAALRIRRRVQVRISAGNDMPMTWGSFSPKVLLPREALDWPAPRLRSVLAHELAHVARFDSLTQQAAAATAAIHWYNPLIWFALARLREQQEHACDEHALRSGIAARDYARDLLDSAYGLSGAPTAAVAMTRGTQLERRLKAILRPDRPTWSRSMGRLLLVGSLAGASVAAAAPLNSGESAGGPAVPKGAVYVAAQSPSGEIRLIRRTPASGEGSAGESPPMVVRVVPRNSSPRNFEGNDTVPVVVRRPQGGRPGVVRLQPRPSAARRPVGARGSPVAVISRDGRRVRLFRPAPPPARNRNARN